MARIGIDYTSAARQRAGIGRYTRELVSALLALESPHRYIIFAATGGKRQGDEETRRQGDEGQGAEGREGEGEHVIRPVGTPVGLADSNFQFPTSKLQYRTVPISDDWLARLWHRLRLPVPVEVFTGPLNVFYSPDFVLPPTRHSTRTLLTVHDLSFLHYPEAFVPALRRYLERVVPRSIARADLVLADSASTCSDIVSLLGVPSSKVQVLYSGVSPRFQPQAEPGERERLRARYGLGEQPYILSVGTLQPRKNYVRLTRAFASLKPEMLAPGTQLLIAGGRGWLYEEILGEAEQHGERVRILGFVDDADLPALYRHAALFAFPSLYEGFGLPVLEAMACGVPVVCSNASSLPEVAGDAALLVDPLDTDGLAAALARALADGDLRQGMIARGLAQATRFTWGQAARQLLGVFSTLGSNT